MNVEQHTIEAALAEWGGGPEGTDASIPAWWLRDWAARQLWADHGETPIGRITIVRVLTTVGRTVDHRFIDDGSGDELDQTTAVAMLAVAQHSILNGLGE